MNALLRPAAPAGRFTELTVGDLGAVLAIEAAAYAFPWSRGNFIDSLAAGHPAQAFIDPAGELIGYFVAMAGVDEFHLLNLTVAPPWQGRGLGRRLLDRLVDHCRDAAAARLWLEVRVSNQRARDLYLRYGFREVGLRRRYYPAPHGQREDAAVLSLDLRHGDDSGGDGDALV